MSRLRTLERLLSTSDAAFNWGVRGLALMGVTLGPSAILGGLVWVSRNWYLGVLVALAAWALLQMGLYARAAMQGMSGTAPVPTPVPQEIGPQPEADNDSLPYPPPRPLPPDAKSRQHFPNLSFRLVELIPPEHAIGQTKVRAKTFYNCTLHGPAILSPTNTRFSGNNEFFNEPRSALPDSMLYEANVYRPRTYFVGIIGIEDCVFHDCTFVDIGFFHDSPVMQMLRDHIARKGDIDIEA